ncbi:MAG: hypothetical protein WCT39_02520 [Candidatus Margulisiibacteriota bacterium]
MKRIISTMLVISILGLTVTASLAEANQPLTATDRIKNMATEESNWRWITGGVKVIAGVLVTAGGYSLFNAGRDNFFKALALIPLGTIVMVPGVLMFGWGGYDLLFGSRDYENQYDKLSKVADTDRETQALDYLKTESAKDKQDRQPSFWNGFGVFSMFETPAEREYKAYLKDRGNF